MNSRLCLNQVREAKELSEGRCLKEEKHWKVQHAEKLHQRQQYTKGVVLRRFKVLRISGGEIKHKNLYTVLAS